MGVGGMKKPAADLSVIIVSFNTKAVTAACLASVFASEFPPQKLEVIVVDNASSDGSGEMVAREFPRAKLIQSSENLGFARANNLGIRKSSGKFVLLLNSDTQFEKGTLTGVLSFVRKNGFEAATARLVLPDGQLDPACHRGFPTPWAALTYLSGLEKVFPKSRIFSGYHQGYKDFSVVHEIDCPSGAFFLVSRRVVERVGLLDESYFMYAEDIDWAWRIKGAGIPIYFLPQFTVTHLKKQSGRSSTDPERQSRTTVMFHENNRKFFRKNLAGKYPWFVRLPVETFYAFRIAIARSFGK